jgi:hypothetical protein
MSKTKFRPSSFEIRAILKHLLYANYHPCVIVRERKRIRTQMLERARYRKFLPVTDKLRLRVYDGLFSKRD